MTSIKYQTTKIAAEKTAGEISELVRSAGGSRFENRWDNDGNLIGVRFALRTPHGELPVVLRARTDAISRVLYSDDWLVSLSRNERADRIRAQAHRIAWRHLKHLVEAWVAAIQLDLASATELLLGYVETQDDAGLICSYADRFEREQARPQLIEGYRCDCCGAPLSEEDEARGWCEVCDS